MATGSPAQVRRAIRALLADRPRTTEELIDALNVGRPRVRANIGVLKRWGEIEGDGERWHLTGAQAGS